MAFQRDAHHENSAIHDAFHIGMEKERSDDKSPEKVLLVLVSIHQHNIEKIATVIAKVLNAEIKAPHKIRPADLSENDLAGFGSGIYGGNNHSSNLELGDHIPSSSAKKAFLFSTNGAPVKVYDSGRSIKTKNIWE